MRLSAFQCPLFGFYSPSVSEEVRNVKHKKTTTTKMRCCNNNKGQLKNEM